MTRDEKLRMLAAINRAITAIRVAIDELNDWLIENPNHSDEFRVRGEIQRLETELARLQARKEAIRAQANTMAFPGNDVINRIRDRANQVADELAEQQAADALVSAAGRAIDLANTVSDELA